MNDVELNAKRSNAARVTLVVVCGLIVTKGVTAYLTGSLAVVASLLDSALDLVASSFNYLAIRAAATPPDREHRWGHGKAESLSGLLQGAAISASTVTLLYQSVHRLMAPSPIARVDIGVVVLAASSVASVFLTAFLRRAGTRYRSTALSGDAIHYLSDVLTNAAAGVALIAYGAFGAAWVDPVVSLLIAVVLAKSAYDVVTPAIDELMDHELPRATTEHILEVATAASPHVFGVHELRSRRSGRTSVIDLHLEVRADLSFVDVHRVTARVQEAIVQALGDVIVTIHPDPYVAPGEPLDDACSHVPLHHAKEPQHEL